MQLAAGYITCFTNLHPYTRGVALAFCDRRVKGRPVGWVECRYSQRETRRIEGSSQWPSKGQQRCIVLRGLTVFKIRSDGLMILRPRRNTRDKERETVASHFLPTSCGYRDCLVF